MPKPKEKLTANRTVRLPLPKEKTSITLFEKIFPRPSPNEYNGRPLYFIEKLVLPVPYKAGLLFLEEKVAYKSPPPTRDDNIAIIHC